MLTTDGMEQTVYIVINANESLMYAFKTRALADKFIAGVPHFDDYQILELKVYET